MNETNIIRSLGLNVKQFYTSDEHEKKRKKREHKGSWKNLGPQIELKRQLKRGAPRGDVKRSRLNWHNKITSFMQNASGKDVTSS